MISSEEYAKNTVGFIPIHLRLKCSENEKYEKDGLWFVEYMRYIIPSYIFQIQDYDKLKLCYDIVNNNIDGFINELNSFCSPLGELDSLNLKEDVLPYSLVPNKVGVFTGEVIKRKDKFTINLFSQDAIRSKNEQYKKYIEDHKILPELELIFKKAQMQLKEMNEQQIKDFEEQARKSILPDDFSFKNFKTDVELMYQKILKLMYYEQNIKDKKIDTIKDVVIADRCFAKVELEHGKPMIRVLNPLFIGFHKSPDVERVEKGDYCYYRRTITTVDLITKYGEKLTPEEFQRLGVYHTALSAYDKRFDVQGGTATSVRNNLDEEMYRELTPGYAQNNKTVGQHQVNSGTIRDKFNNLIWETHLEFKAFRKIGFLTYLNEYNKEVTELVSDDFDIPKDATKIKFTNKWGDESTKHEWVDEFTMTPYTYEEAWIPRRYEITRLGTDIYVDYREVPNQPINLDNPYSDFELSYKGLVFTNRNTDSISAIGRAKPFIFQGFYIKHLQNRELAKYQGYIQDVNVDAIPDALGEDLEGNKIRDKNAVWTAYRKKLGISYYSDAGNGFGGMAPANRSPGTNGYILGTSMELINLQKLWELINVEIGMAMGISPQREAMSNSSMTATDNDRNLAQSYTITEYYFDKHNEFWKSVIAEYLKQYRVYLSKVLETQSEHLLHYVLPDGSEELIGITKEHLEFDQIGLYLNQSGQDSQYREAMLSVSQAISQNAGEGATIISNLLRMITSGESADEIHKEIMILENRNKERTEQMEKYKQEMQAKQIQMQIDAREDEQSHEVELETIRGEYGIKEALVKTYINQESLNADADGIPDPLETLKMYEDMNNNKRKLNIEEEKLKLTKHKIDTEASIKRQQNKNKSK